MTISFSLFISPSFSMSASLSPSIFASIFSSLSASVSLLTSAGISVSANIYVFADSSMSTASFISANLIPSPSACPVIPVIQDMTKPFFIEKQVISVNNTTVQIYDKHTILVGSILFPGLDKSWWYILGILNQTKRLEVAEDVIY